MKKVIVGIIIAAALIGGGYTVMSMTHVGQGEIGVVYSMKGGVKDKTLGPGFHFVGPTDKVKDYPVSQQQLVLSNNPSDYGEKEHADWHVDEEGWLCTKCGRLNPNSSSICSCGKHRF